MPSIKDFTQSQRSKKSGSTETPKKKTPSTEKRLSGEHGNTDSYEEDEKEMNPFTEEQKVAMDKIMLAEGKDSSSEEIITAVKTQMPSSNSKKEEDKMDRIMAKLRGK